MQGGPERLVRYRSYIADNDRWHRFELRPDDIIITVPSKSGTTWTQTLVALLVFDGVPDTPVFDLSPWLDMNLRSEDDVFALLARQQHRRFIKTHAPLDGLPQHDEVTYVSVGRDPRDAFVSMISHGQNLDRDRIAEIRIAAVGDDDLADLPDMWPDSSDPQEHVEAFLTIPAFESHSDVNLANLLRHLRQAWDARHRPNHLLLHYADMSEDLPRELRRLRDALGIDRSDDRVEELARLATLDAMRRRAGTVAPEAGMGAWKDDASFFRGGRHGDGAALMTEDQLARYEERCRELHGDDPAFLHWVHHGSA